MIKKTTPLIKSIKFVMIVYKNDNIQMMIGLNNGDEQGVSVDDFSI